MKATNSIRRTFTFLALLLFNLTGFSQNFEWLKTFGSQSQGWIWGNTADANGGSTFIFSTTWGNSNDSIKFDKFKFKLTPTEAENFLVQLDTAGKVLKAKPIGIFSSWYMGMTSDSLGNYYVSGYLISNKSSVDSVSLNVNNGRILFAKFDKNLRLVWFTQTGNTKMVYFDESHNLTVFGDKLYFNCITKDTTKIGAKTHYLDSAGNTYIYGELDQNNGKIKWSNYFYSPKKDIQFQIKSMVKLNNKLYYAGNLTASMVIIKNDTLYGWGGFVIETDTLGNYIKRFNFYNHQYLKVNSITTDGKQLFIAGVFKDSLKWGNKKIGPGYRTGTYPLQYKNSELFVASLSASLNPGWFFHPKVYDTTYTYYGGSWINTIKYTGGFLYLGGRLVGSIIIDSNILSSHYSDALILKADIRGNILWATQGNSGISGSFLTNIEALPDRSVFAVGFYSSKIQFGKFKDSMGQKGYVVKITDYSITRGKVSAGPYCAGDTIKVPYTLIGNFDTSNYFVAELSDENGSFTGNYRELGRLKTNKKGTIKGVLPLFQVASSPYYRIRIRSTKPAIQSYYVFDTLRLLIYSRDKANPGLPQTICRGDTLKLNTYGGTKWMWSPKYRMSDPAKRQPLVWPIKDTTYQIIISDSSGCGQPDTAYKQIFIRQELKAILKFKDTALCENINLKIPVHFEGGDSNYYWQWFFVNSPKSFFPMGKGKLKSDDTLSYNTTVDVNNSENLALILSDGCSSKKDTVLIKISQRSPVVITTKFRDTSLCSGHLSIYKSTATGGVPKQYHYQWKDLVSNTVLSKSDSLKITTAKTLKIQLIVNDGCGALGDTTLFTITVKPPLKLTSNLRDTIICFGKTVTYTATAQGGDSKAYKFSWVINNKIIDTLNYLQLTINNSSSLSLILKDNCTLPNDSIKKTITIKPGPKAAFKYDLACSKTITNFQFTGTKPSSPITTSFRWDFNNEATSSIETPSHKFAAEGNSITTLILSSDNGCTDTLRKTIEIKPQSKADFTANDVCENDSVVFINKSKDATGYNWKFGDGAIGNWQSAKHKYKITSTTTFNVTLVALVANGCSDSVVHAVTVNQNPNSGFSHTLTGTRLDLKANIGGLAKYKWTFGTTDSITTTSQTSTHTQQSGQNKVCLTVADLAGCSSQTCKDITVGISNIEKPSGFKIYPNPNNGNFTVEIENPANDISIEVYDLLGKQVKRVETSANKSTSPVIIKVSLSGPNPLGFGTLDLSLGIYFVRVKNGMQVWNERVLVSFGGDTNR